MKDDIYREFTGSSSNLSFIYDIASGKFTYTDKALKQLLLLEMDGFSPDSLFKYLSSQEQAHLGNCLPSILDGTFTGHVELCLDFGDESKWIRVTPILFKLKGLRIVAGNVIDITDEVNNINTLKKYANKKNSILNLLSHDLRGPLGIANTLTDVLGKEVNDPQLANFVKTIATILKQSIDLIADLTKREFLETAEIELVKKRIDIAGAMKEVMDEYRRSEWAAERVFQFSSSSESFFISLDEPKFIQVINNLMSNALKFTRNKGVISLSLTEQDTSVLFTFSDDGIGIPEEFHSSLFDKFTEARRKGLRGEPTVGLGLSIVKTIIDWHHGRIWFDTEVNKGTTFYIEIPKN